MGPREVRTRALVALRDSQVDRALERLAAAIEARVSAERALALCEERCAEHDASVAGVTAAEAEALARGELGAADLARADAWKIRATAERDALCARRDRALETCRTAIESEAAAREAAIVCRGDARLVHDDRRRWNDRVRSAVEVAEDEARSEAWRPPQ